VKLHKHFYIAMAILAFSAIMGELYFRWLIGVGAGEVVPLERPLSTIPKNVSGWTGIESKMKADVLMKVGSTDYVRRTYYQGKKTLQFYVVYFGGVRGTAPHHPDVCMPGGGWHNIQSDVVSWQVSGFGEAKLRVHQDVFEHKNLHKRLVVWWEYVHGRNVASRTLQRLLWALPPAFGGQRGSVLQVQISMDYEGDQTTVLEDIRSFTEGVGPYIEAVLPETNGSDTQTKTKAE